MKLTFLPKGYTTTAAKITAGMLSSVTKLAVQTVVSLVLGFMLVWDMPSIKQGVATLARCGGMDDNGGVDWLANGMVRTL